MRFEIEVELDGGIYSYGIAFEFPPGFKALRVLEEKPRRLMILRIDFDDHKERSSSSWHGFPFISPNACLSLAP